jgi:hypothetical protein
MVLETNNAILFVRWHKLLERLAGSTLGAILQTLAGEPIDSPFRHRFSLKRLIKADCWFVPIEHGPFDAAAALLNGKASELNQKRFAVSLAAVRRPDKKVFEIDSGPAQKSRVRIEIESEANHFSGIVCQQHLGERPGPEQMLAETTFLDHHFVAQALIFGQLANELADERRVVGLSFADHGKYSQVVSAGDVGIARSSETHYPVRTCRLDQGKTDKPAARDSLDRLFAGRARTYPNDWALEDPPILTFRWTLVFLT